MGIVRVSAKQDLTPIIDAICGKTLKPRDYPQSLRWFLQDNGYIPHAP